MAGLRLRAWLLHVVEEKLMLHNKTEEWCFTDNGVLRGHITPQALKTLWIHTGTTCNLNCPFCFEGSAPGDDRVEMITYTEAVKVIDAGVEQGAEQIAFTGGEPFVNPDMLQILEYCLDKLPVLVLTNGTRPLQNKMDQIKLLHSKPFKLTFRISLDCPEPGEHDVGRGAGNFELAIQTMHMLHQAGFTLAVARISHPKENADSVAGAYRQMFKDKGLPEDIPLIAFPVLAESGQSSDTPEITEHCIATYCDEEKLRSFMCGYSKMAVKKHGRVGFYACTLVDDDDMYNLGDSLDEAMKCDIMLKHPRCFSCFAEGVSCDE